MTPDATNHATITQAQVRRLFHYDATTGALVWAVRLSPRAGPGDAAGCITKWGYLQVRINGRGYFAHRLVWLYVRGKWPRRHLDHINGRKIDNRLCNLREATNVENAHNMRAHKTSSSAFKGVCLVSSGKWQVAICSHGKHHYLGCYSDEEDAARAYDKAAKKLHGEFASLNF